jgi:hypothetical protein
MPKFLILFAAAFLLSACGDARDPGYVCMTDCAHFCPDGMSGDSCRAQQQQENKRNEQDEQQGGAY